MKTSSRVYTFGLWSVKPGMESVFAAAWEAFATWSVEHVDGAIEADLLQDALKPQLFISIGPWKDAASIQAWRDLPEFKAFVAQARELCSDLQPHVLKPVVHVARR